jgi:hypothetical protein
LEISHQDGCYANTIDVVSSDKWTIRDNSPAEFLLDSLEEKYDGAICVAALSRGKKTANGHRYDA